MWERAGGFLRTCRAVGLSVLLLIVEIISVWNFHVLLWLKTGGLESSKCVPDVLFLLYNGELGNRSTLWPFDNMVGSSRGMALAWNTKMLFILVARAWCASVWSRFRLDFVL